MVISELIEHKKDILSLLDKKLNNDFKLIDKNSDKKKNTSLLNKIIKKYKDDLFKSFEDLNKKLIIEYCCSVKILEYRDLIWSYDTISLTRRIGELWQQYCSLCWTFSRKENLTRIKPPSFFSILENANKKWKINKEDFNQITNLIGEINMIEDETFVLNKVPYVVDFKSGFGSNEKGNTMRLFGVGRAYKLWNEKTELLILVKQNELNNNYLKILTNSNLWKVYMGVNAYKKIDQITGSSTFDLSKNIYNFEKDFNSKTLEKFSKMVENYKTYLTW